MRVKSDKQNRQEEAVAAGHRQSAEAPAHARRQADAGAALLKLQRTHGNNFVQRLLSRASQPGTAGPPALQRAEDDPAKAPAPAAGAAPAPPTPATPTPETVPPAEKTDPQIESLDLEATAKAGAQKLKEQHPEISFTSGRRDRSDQARAMASNVVSSGNRNWIADTYTAAADKLQKWVDDHPEAKTVAELTKGLQEILDGMPDSSVRNISRHLSGEAFDVQPQEKDADKIKADMKALSGATKFLEKEGGLIRWHVQFKRAPALQREAAGKADSGDEAPPVVHDVLRSPGQPLDSGARDFMESRLGVDLGDVRVHTDARAAESARSVNALAYTVGNNVVFGAGQYAPETDKGKELLAHELTHVIQQGGGMVRRKLVIGQPDDEYEREADHVAREVMRQPQHAHGDGEAAGTVQRHTHGAEDDCCGTVARQTGGVLRRRLGPANAPTQTLSTSNAATPAAEPVLRRQTPPPAATPPPPPPAAAAPGAAKAPAAAPPVATPSAAPAAPTAAPAPAAAAPKTPAPIDLSPAGVKASLDAVTVTSTTSTEPRLRPELMFALAPANTDRKKELFDQARTTFKALQKAQDAANTAAGGKSAKAIADATKRVEEAEKQFKAAIKDIKDYVRKEAEDHDPELKTLRKNETEAKKKLEAVTAAKPKKSGPKGAPATPEDVKAAEAHEVELKAAQKAVTDATAAITKRKEAIAKQVEEGQYDPVDVERTSYKITVDGETVSLYDHVEAYATTFEKGIEAKEKGDSKSRVSEVLKASGLSSSRQKILGAISSYEGGFAATQTWDRAVLTWGFVQWTGGSKSDLVQALNIIKERAPEAFKARFQKYGIDVDKKELIITRFKEPEGAAGEGEAKPPVAEHVRGDDAALAVRGESTPKLAAIMSRAGLDPDIQAAEIQAANVIEIDRPLKHTFEVTFPPPAPAAAATAPATTATTAAPAAATTPAATTTTPAAGAAPATAKPPEAKKPDAPVKKEIRVGDIITSEFGVGMLANGVVHAGFYGTVGKVRTRVREFVQNEKPDPENIKSWAGKAEQAVLASITEKSRVKAFVDSGCSKDPGTFDPPPAPKAEEKK